MNASRVNDINSLKVALRYMELKKREYKSIDALCQEKAKLIKPSGIFLFFSGIVLWLFLCKKTHRRGAMGFQIYKILWEVILLDK